MTKKQRYEAILSYFRQEMPEADTELEFGSIFQLLVAVTAGTGTCFIWNFTSSFYP